MARWALLFISVMILSTDVIISEFRSDIYSFSTSLHNYDIEGFYDEVDVMSDLECARVCTGYATCKTFSYLQSSSACYLYETWACNETGTVQTGREYYKKAEKLQSDPVVLDCGNQKKDILFMLDSSGSVNNGELNNEKYFVNLTLSYFNLGADKIQVAMMFYNVIAQEAFFLNAYNDVTSAQAVALAAARVSGSGSAREDVAFQFAFNTVFQSGNGDRADADNIIIFITDDAMFTDYMTEVNKFDADTEFFAFGIGGRPVRSEMEAIASDPASDHVFEVANFYALPALAATAATFACPRCPLCLNQGVCDRTLGRCLCPHGYTGERCEGCID